MERSVCKKTIHFASSGFQATRRPPMILEAKFASTVKPMTTPTDLKTTENMSVKKMMKIGPLTLMRIGRTTSHVTEPSNVSENPNATTKIKTNEKHTNTKNGVKKTEHEACDETGEEEWEKE